ncbi:hypothetical protein GGR61_003303 [Xanthomonas arboricola]|nr:hypothetical protein [Xanthomonas sp. 3058]
MLEGVAGDHQCSARQRVVHKRPLSLILGEDAAANHRRADEHALRIVATTLLGMTVPSME